MSKTRMDPDSEIPSEALAELIIDDLTNPGIISKSDFQRVGGIATEETKARKADRDYWCSKCVHQKPSQGWAVRA